MFRASQIFGREPGAVASPPSGKGTVRDEWNQDAEPSDATSAASSIPGTTSVKGSKWSGSAGGCPGATVVWRPPAPQRPLAPTGSAGRHQWQSPPARPVTASTISLHGVGLSSLGEDAIDKACRHIAIIGGFSVQEKVCIVSLQLAHVEFPHRDAAAQFFEATKGELQIKGQPFKVRHPHGGAVQGASVDTGTPTDTLLIRRIGDATERELQEAFVKCAPRLRGVKIPKDFAGHSKGNGYVMFHEVHEAVNALRHFRSANCMVAGRSVTIEFAPPQSMEEVLERKAQEQRAAEDQRASHAQALSGPNADMWATYLAMFNNEPAAKRMRIDAGS